MEDYNIDGIVIQDNDSSEFSQENDDEFEKKKCGSCHYVLPISHFDEDRTTNTGYQSNCKNCRSIKYRTGSGDDLGKRYCFRCNKTLVAYRFNKEGRIIKNIVYCKQCIRTRDDKVCLKCGNILLISQFGIDKSQRDGHSKYCLCCSATLRRNSRANIKKHYLACKPFKLKTCPRCMSDVPISRFYDDKCIICSIELNTYHKACTKCGINQHISQFYKKKYSYNTYTYHCKTCISER